MPKQPTDIQRAMPKKRKSKLQLDLETLQQYFCMPLFLAAQRLGVSTTTLKKQCREHGFERWPHVAYLRAQMLKKAEDMDREAKQSMPDPPVTRSSGSPNEWSCDSQSEAQGSGGSGSESHSQDSRSSGKRSLGSISQSGSQGSGSSIGALSKSESEQSSSKRSAGARSGTGSSSSGSHGRTNMSSGSGSQSSAQNSAGSSSVTGSQQSCDLSQASTASNGQQGDDAAAFHASHAPLDSFSATAHRPPTLPAQFQPITAAQISQSSVAAPSHQHNSSQLGQSQLFALGSQVLAHNQHGQAHTSAVGQPWGSNGPHVFPLALNLIPGSSRPPHTPGGGLAAGLDFSANPSLFPGGSQQLGPGRGPQTSQGGNAMQDWQLAASQSFNLNLDLDMPGPWPAGGQDGRPPLAGSAPGNLNSGPGRQWVLPPGSPGPASVLGPSQLSPMPSPSPSIGGWLGPSGGSPSVAGSTSGALAGVGLARPGSSSPGLLPEFNLDGMPATEAEREELLQRIRVQRAQVQLQLLDMQEELLMRPGPATAASSHPDPDPGP